LGKAQVSMERVLVGRSSSSQKKKKNRLERRRKDGQGRDNGASRPYSTKTWRYLIL
jgi:hypothetical protein